MYKVKLRFIYLNFNVTIQFDVSNFSKSAPLDHSSLQSVSLYESVEQCSRNVQRNRGNEDNAENFVDRKYLCGKFTVLFEQLRQREEAKDRDRRAIGRRCNPPDERIHDQTEIE